MNNIFKEKEVIVLDENYRIEPDQFNGVVLVFSEPRKRQKLDDKRKKTGETEDFIYEDQWFYPRVAQALQEYLKQRSNTRIDLQSVIDNTQKALDVITKFDKRFKQYA